MSRRRTSRSSGKKLSLDDRNEFVSNGGGVPLNSDKHSTGRFQLSDAEPCDYANNNMCDDPPVISYESPDANDDERSIGSENSQENRRHQLMKLAEQLDDCWEANLSDDENITHASIARRRTMPQSYEKLSGYEVEESFLEMNIQQDPTFSNGDEKNHIDSFPGRESESMSLPEQLLKNRLRRKQRLHEKHHMQEVTERRQSERKAQIKYSIGHHTENSSEVCAASPLFPDDHFDDDNASIIATSNGASNSYSNIRSTHKQNDQCHLDNSTASSPLNSLPQRPICVFPDESDRKCCLGCLAAVLASAYAYETAPHLLVKETKIGCGFPMVDGREQTISQSAPDEDLGSFQAPDTFNLQSRENNQFLDPVDCRYSSKSITLDTSELRLHHKMQLSVIQQSRDYQEHQHRKPSLRSRSSSPIDLNAKKSSPTNSIASLHHSFSFASLNTNMFEKVGSKCPPPSLTTELAEIRHRIRRHAIYSELLVSSAEMLLLDSSHAKGFLPMLEGLLTKVEMPNTSQSVNFKASNGQSWKGRGFGGGGLHCPDFNGENDVMASARSNFSTSCDAPLASQPKETTSTTRTTLPSNEQINGLPTSGLNHTDDTSVPTKHGCDSDASRHRNLYESFPSSRRSQSSFENKQHKRRSHCPQKYAPLETAIVEADLVTPFLQTLTPGAGYRCIALLLLNYLLRDGRGYDARVRQAFKRLAVIVLSHEFKVGGILRVELDDDEDLEALMSGDDELKRRSSKSFNEEDGFDDADELALLATRKFEALERAIAEKLISVTCGTHPPESSASTKRANNRQKQSTREAKRTGPTASSSSSTHGCIALAPKASPTSSQHGISKEQILRGIKVGSAGALGATLFAITGGLAAPGIAAGLAAVAGTSAIAAGVSTVLSSAAAISTIFGVGGAGLAGYKMHRRTKGLTEFNFNKESGGKRDSDVELFGTICISGWLRDNRDFQRPWGVSPSHPRIVDKKELLERFYFIHNPDNVYRVGEILKHWKGRYFQLWKALGKKYGRDPSGLFPLESGPRISAELTHEEGEEVDFIIDELGCFPKNKHPKKAPPKPRSSTPADTKITQAQEHLRDSSLKPKTWLPGSFSMTSTEIAASLSLFSESESSNFNDTFIHTTGSASNTSNRVRTQSSDLPKTPPTTSPPKHLLTVWDYHANYGGELYTVQWESELLMELCDSVSDQLIEWGISATKTILHTTVFATLMTAVTLPYTLILAANAIDSSWAMAMERADRAGVELAKSLIDSTAGHRPVILAGFSMGARVIYSCLKELARHQEIWEAHQQKKRLPPKKIRNSNLKEADTSEDCLKYIREPASIVEDAILMGTPNHISLKSWEACRRVIAGRLINCYSRKDLILSLMFQMKRFQGILRPVCGTSPVSVNGVENFDVTDLVSAHTDYCLVSGEILKRVRHGQPQRASASKTDVSAMVTMIKVANKEIGGLASLSDEAAVVRGR
jgi:hypothetical protein